MLGQDSLENWYHTNFGLIQHHKYSLNDIEHMIPFERALYIKMLLNWQEEQAERLKEEQSRKHGSR